MAAPVVQSLASIIADLDPAYAPQRALFEQQKSLLPGQKEASIKGLEASKLNSFRDINTGANSKGMAFSGIPAAEQARYLGEKYLPAVAGVESDFISKDFNLSQALASLFGEQRLKGIDIRGGQEKTLQAYMEAERDRQFRAQEAAKTRQHEAAQAAANRAATAAVAKQQGAPSGLVDGISNLFNKKKGGDGFVSPNTFREGMSKWIKEGGSPDSYLQTFSGYINPVHQERFGGYY